MVDHKHVVSLLGYCEAPEKHILVYEYLRGGDLAERLGGIAHVLIVSIFKTRPIIISIHVLIK